VKPTPAMFQDTVSIETYSGESAYGPIYAASANVVCKVSTARQLVRNSAGDEVVSEATLYVLPADATPFTPESRVTIAGRMSTVLSVAPQTARGVTVVVKVTCS
jgi:hypothetical protein